MHLTVRSNHAMRLMMFCALNPTRTTPIAEIARACNMSEAHLGKIAHALSANGFVETVRGRRGGVRLGRSPRDLNVGEIVRRTEFGSCLVECLNPESNTCPLVSACRFRSILGQALDAFLRVLDGYTLADLVADPAPLKALMGMDRPQPEHAMAY